MASRRGAESSPRSNIALTEVFSNSLWSQYRHIVGPDGAEVRAVGAAHPEIRRLDADVTHPMRGSKVYKVKVYDLHGLTV